MPNGLRPSSAATTLPALRNGSGWPALSASRRTIFRGITLSRSGTCVAMVHNADAQLKSDLHNFAAGQILVSLARADHAVGGALHHHLGSTRARIVIRRLDKAIGAGGADGEEIAGHHVGHVT